MHIHLGLLAAPIAVTVVAQTTRHVLFVNQCSSDVWVLPTAGSAGRCAAGCPEGSSCQPSSGNCYFHNPTPVNGNYRVPKGGDNTIVYPVTNNPTAVWTGNYGFCQSGTSCQLPPNECDMQGCRSTGPYNVAEFNLIPKAADVYDVSIIAGVTVPVSITPQVVDGSNVNKADPYTCGNPGSAKPNNAQLGASSWKLSAPSTLYQWVTPPNMSALKNCKNDKDCPEPQVCGVIDQDNKLQEVCGNLSGYWSENEICATGLSTQLFPCSIAIKNGPYSTTVGELQGCNGVSGSCYTAGADSHCCGCVNWDTLLGPGHSPNSTSRCANNNPVWDNQVLPTIKFLKEACPNCYTYPYDDMSSTFTCEKSYDGWNTQNYTVTLCAGGVSWGVTGDQSKPFLKVQV